MIARNNEQEIALKKICFRNIQSASYYRNKGVPEFSDSLLEATMQTSDILKAYSQTAYIERTNGYFAESEQENIRTAFAKFDAATTCILNGLAKVQIQSKDNIKLLQNEFLNPDRWKTLSLKINRLNDMGQKEQQQFILTLRDQVLTNALIISKFMADMTGTTSFDTMSLPIYSNPVKNTIRKGEEFVTFVSYKIFDSAYTGIEKNVEIRVEGDVCPHQNGVAIWKQRAVQTGKNHYSVSVSVMGANHEYRSDSKTFYYDVIP